MLINLSVGSGDVIVGLPTIELVEMYGECDST